MLKLNELTLRSNGNKILDTITCEFNPGEIVALLGPSGSGKTSLMRCIARLEPTDPGAIVMDGVAIQALKPTDIGMVFQQFHLFPHLTVLENLCYSPERLEIMTEQTCNPKAMEMLKRFGGYPPTPSFRWPETTRCNCPCLNDGTADSVV